MLTVVADENIPGLEDLIGKVASIRYLPGRTMSAEHLRDADVLLVRSVTKVDAALLEGSKVRFVGTCTIGKDHVDEQWLQSRGIGFASAPGCNAEAVVDYVLAALFAVFESLDVLRLKKVGIVGIGQVGGRLMRRLQALQIHCIACDPFQPAAIANMDDILACDIISLHVPYTIEGVYATHHLMDAVRLSCLKEGSLLINTSRGSVVDNNALDDLLVRRKIHAVLDVYEAEPCPDMAFLRRLDIATAHIAGYSLQGKIRGSAMVAEAMYHFFGIENQVPDLLTSLMRQIVVKVNVLDKVVHDAYDIRLDSAAFLEFYEKAVSPEEKRYAFDAFRKNYPVRYEWGFTEIEEAQVSVEELRCLGFKTK